MKCNGGRNSGRFHSVQEHIHYGEDAYLGWMQAASSWSLRRPHFTWCDTRRSAHCYCRCYGITACPSPASRGSFRPADDDHRAKHAVRVKRLIKAVDQRWLARYTNGCHSCPRRQRPSPDGELWGLRCRQTMVLHAPISSGPAVWLVDGIEQRPSITGVALLVGHRQIKTQSDRTKASSVTNGDAKVDANAALQSFGFCAATPCIYFCPRGPTNGLSVSFQIDRTTPQKPK
jgi:hypothetical protein